MNKASMEGQTVTFEETTKESLKNLAPNLLLTCFLIYGLVVGMFAPFPWYYNVMITCMILPVIGLIIYLMMALGLLDGKGKIRFTEEGFIYSFPQSNFDKWVSKKIGLPAGKEHVFIPWNSIHRIDCKDKRREDRKRNKTILPEPQIIFSYLDGQEFIFYDGVFTELSRGSPKKRRIYEELKKEAAQRGIQFTTELESEDSWTGPFFHTE